MRGKGEQKWHVGWESAKYSANKHAKLYDFDLVKFPLWRRKVDESGRDELDREAGFPDYII